MTRRCAVFILISLVLGGSLFAGEEANKSPDDFFLDEYFDSIRKRFEQFDKRFGEDSFFNSPFQGLKGFPRSGISPIGNECQFIKMSDHQRLEFPLNHKSDPVKMEASNGLINVTITSTKKVEESGVNGSSYSESSSVMSYSCPLPEGIGPDQVSSQVEEKSKQLKFVIKVPLSGEKTGSDNNGSFLKDPQDQAI